MATINRLGNIVAQCPTCDGAKSRFESVGEPVVGQWSKPDPSSPHRYIYYDHQYRLFRCAGCGRGAIAIIKMKKVGGEFPDSIDRLIQFWPEATGRLRLPASVPDGIRHEFDEAEKCTEAQCFRAATAMFRSVLDKVLRGNGYNTKEEPNLKKQIDAAAEDGVITESRKKRAHEDIRVLGNDVLHDEWHPIDKAAVDAAHTYIQRTLEDFYDDRETVLKLLREKKRIKEEPDTSRETEASSSA